jgi:L-amino acid N-acyltransferase YncA
VRRRAAPGSRRRRRAEALVRYYDEYGLRALVASATLENAGSPAVLRRTGFTPVGEVMLDGRPGLRHVRELTAGASSRC